MKQELTYSRAQQMLSNWDALDGLRDDEAIKAFHINCAIEDTFKALEKNEIKLSNERQEIIKEIQEEVQARKKASDQSVKDTEIQQAPNGGISFQNLPDDITEKHQADISRIGNELQDMRQKTKTVTFDPLTKDDLMEHNMCTNKVLRTFKEIVDISASKEDGETEKAPKEEAA